MMTNCAAIREAYKAILADWKCGAPDVKANESQLVYQTAVLASVQLDDIVSEEHVRRVLNLSH